ALVPVASPQSIDVLLHDSAQRLERVGAPAIDIAVAPDLPAVLVDPVQLDQVVTNLVDNAARHGRGAPVHIAARRQGDAIEITFADDGPGCSDEARRHAFEPFRSTDGSTGIGLSVCKAIVEAHHGTITVVDPVAGGGAPA